MQLQFISTSIEKLAVQLTLESQTIANFYIHTEVDVLVLDFTRNAVCAMSVRNGRRISRTTCETKKARGKCTVTITGRTLIRKRHLPGHTLLLVIGRILIRKGHLPGHPPIPVIGRTLRRKGCPSIPVIGRTLRRKGRPPMPVIGRTLTREGQLPGYLPVLITGGILVRKGLQFA